MKNIIGLLLIIILSVTDIFLFRIGIIPLEPSMTLLPLLFLLIFIGYSEYFKLLMFNNNAGVFLLFFILSVLYAIPSNYDGVGYMIGNQFLTFICYTFVSVFVLKTPDKYLKIIFAAAFFILAASVLKDLVSASSTVNRGAGFAENPNSSALRLVMLSTLCLIFISEKKIAIIFIVISFSAIFLTLSRSGLIMYAMSTVMIVAYKFGGVQKLRKLPLFFVKFLPFIVILIAIFFFIITFVSTYITSFDSRAASDRIKQITGQSSLIDDADVSDEGRVSIAQDYLEYIIKNPFGYGTGTSSDRDFYFKATHNMYLRVGIDYGFVGEILLLYMLFAGIRRSIKANDFYGLAFYITTMLACLFTNTLFENRTFIICLACMDLRNITLRKQQLAAKQQLNEAKLSLPLAS